MKKSMGALVVVIVSVFFAGQAFGLVPIPNGDTVYNYSPVAGSPVYSGPTLPSFFTGGNNVATLTSSITSPGGMTGLVTTEVYEDPANGNRLSFEYLFTIYESSTADLHSVTINDASNPWVGHSILDAGADASGTTTVPSSGNTPNWTNGNPYNMFYDASTDGSGLGIEFENAGAGTELDKGNTSAEIWVTTDANSYQLSNVNLLDSTTGEAQAYTPLTLTPPVGIPEPATLTLLGLGLSGLLLRRRQK